MQASCRPCPPWTDPWTPAQALDSGVLTTGPQNPSVCCYRQTLPGLRDKQGPQLQDLEKRLWVFCSTFVYNVVLVGNGETIHQIEKPSQH